MEKINQKLPWHARRPHLRETMGLVLMLTLSAGCAAETEPRFGGYLEAEQIEVGSRVGGRIEAVFVEEGDTVSSGTVLVRFEREHLEAELEEVRHRAERLKTTLAKLEAGPRRQEIEVARQKWSIAVAQLKNATSTYSRRRETGEFTSAEDLEQAATNLATAQGEERAAREQLDLLEEGTRAEDILIARRALDEAEARVRLLEDQLNESEVVAPLDAVVEICDVEPGDLIAAGAPLATLVRKDEIWVRCFVPTTQITFLKSGQNVDVEVDSRPGDVFAGKVLRIHRVAEYTPRNVQTFEQREDQVFGVKVAVDDPNDLLRPGMAAVVRLRSGSSAEEVTPPPPTEIVNDSATIEQEKDPNGGAGDASTEDTRGNE